MKKPCKQECNYYRKKEPYCKQCYFYTKNKDDPIMAPVLFADMRDILDNK